MFSGRKNSKRNLSSDNSFEKGENNGTVKKAVTKPDPKRTKASQNKEIEIEKQQTVKDLFSQAATASASASYAPPDYNMQSVIEQLEIINQKLITKDDLREHLEETKNKIIQSMTETIEKLEARVLTLEIEKDNLEKKLKFLNVKCEQSEEVAKLATYKSELAMRRLNDLEQHGRKDSVRMFGVRDLNQQETAEKTVDVVVDVLSRINLKISKNDISIAHRLGRFVQNKPRPIIVKFKSRIHKNQVLYQRRKLKGTGMGISEDLTSKNYEYLQKLQHHKDVETAWTRDANFFVKMKESGQIKKIDPFEFLAEKTSFESDTVTED